MTLLNHPGALDQAGPLGRDDDGDPVWPEVEGARLAPDVRAWQRLGVGGRCEVWLGWCERLWTPVVAKLPRPHQVANPRARAALLREVRALEGTLHPNLPRLYRADLDADLPYVVEEHVDGPDLETYLHGRRTRRTAVALLGVQLLSALRPLHARGVAHLDVTPANVVLREGRPVLVDLGSSRPLGATQPPGRPVGTLGWVSPEQEACRPVSAAMDVYGVGAVLRHAAARRRPGRGWASFDAVVGALTDPSEATRPNLDVGLRLLAATLPAARAGWPPWALTPD